ncbi:MAG: radical SAM protein [Bacteroidota bacterium]|nr:radical SAM protein [Bacteroidota bacterium]
MAFKVLVLAPMVDDVQYHLDLNVRFRKNDLEMSFDNLNQFFLHDFDEDKIPADNQHEEDIPAAGYYLTSLLKKAGYEVWLSSANDERRFRQVSAFSPEIICLSTTMIISVEALNNIVSRIRKFMPGVFIIAGGVFVWKNYLSAMSHLFESTEGLEDYGLFSSKKNKVDVDAWVIDSHGAKTLLKLLDELSKGGKAMPGNVPNLILPDAQNFLTETKRQAEQVDFNQDITDWTLIDEMPSRIPLRTSIGCPYRCSFCDFCKLFPEIFLRSKESIEKELQSILQRKGDGTSLIHVTDDNVFLNQKRLHEICEVFIRQKQLNWISFMRASSINEMNIEKVSRSGLLVSLVGLESGDDDQLKNMHKQMNVHQQKKGIELMDAHGIYTYLSLIVGFPGESDNSIRNTTDFLNGLALTNAFVSYNLYPLFIFPMSEMSEKAFRAKWSLQGMYDQWSHSTMNAKEVNASAYTLFSGVKSLPYNYFHESNFYLRGMFSLAERNNLFSLRNELTKQIIVSGPELEKFRSLRSIARIMDHDIPWQKKHIVEKLYVRDKAKIKL